MDLTFAHFIEIMFEAVRFKFKYGCGREGNQLQ